MRITKPKKIKAGTVKTVGPPKKTAKRTGLSKSDPDYFKKLGEISASRRKLTSEDMAEMAKLSHPRPVYKGGRKKRPSS